VWPEEESKGIHVLTSKFYDNIVIIKMPRNKSSMSKKV
jgi:hypothetical protein